MALIDTTQLLNLKELAAGDASFLVNVIDAFLPQLRSAPVALREAVDEATPAAVAEIAHSLKGSAGNVGAEDVSKLCLSIERLARQGRLESVPPLIDELVSAAKATYQAFEDEKSRLT